MANIVFRKRGSIETRIFEAFVPLVVAEKRVKELNGILWMYENGFTFAFELEPHERATVFVSHKRHGKLRQAETDSASYPFVYQCDTCETQIATDTTEKQLCPSCHQSVLKTRLNHLEYCPTFKKVPIT